MKWFELTTRWTVETVLNLPLFTPVLIAAVVLALSLERSPTQSPTPAEDEPVVEEPETMPTYAEAVAAAEEAAGLSPGTLGDYRDVWNVFMRCGDDVSIITPPTRQRRCYGWGAALLTYFDVLRPAWDPDDLAAWERPVIQRMEALGWLDGGQPAFQPLGFGAGR